MTAVEMVLYRWTDHGFGITGWGVLLTVFLVAILSNIGRRD